MAEQKLNIVFTGDVSQLNKAIQSAEAELTSFENKLKDSLGTEAFASINQSVDNLRNKFKTLSSIDIKANPQQALTAINEVLTGVAKIKSSEVFLKANNKEALAAITQVESFARSIRATIDVGFDSSEITGKIAELKGKLTGLEADVSVKVTGLDKLNAEILEVRTELNELTNKKIFIDTDTSKAQERIKILEAQLLRLEKISVSPDITIESKGRVDSLAADIQKRLSVLRAEVEITADSSELDTSISNLKSKLASLEAQVKVDAVGLEQVNADLLKTRYLINTFEEIKLIVDSGDTIAEINRIEKELAELQAIVISPDISETQLDLFKRNIDSLKLKLSELQKIPVSLDTSGVGASIDAIKAKALSVFEIDISADPSKALAAIDAVQADIDEIRKNKILLEADNAPALAAIDKLQAELQGLKAKITIDPSGFDTSKLQSLITPLSQRVELKVNTKVAEAEITNLLGKVRDLKGQDILINLDGTQVVKTIDAIEKELLGLQANLKKATDPREVARLNQSLLQLRNSLSGVATNQFTSNVNRAQNATFAFSQVLREAPAFAFSAQTGILALSNNLPILADRFKEARAAGLSMGAIFKDMAKSLVTLPGILTIASTAAIFIAGALSKSGKEASKASDELEEFRDIVNSIGDVRIGAAGEAQGEAVRIQALASAVSDVTLSYKERNRALEELKGINKSYFGDLTLEADQLGKLPALVDEYTKAIAANAIVKEFSEDIGRVGKALAIQRSELNKISDARKKLDSPFQARDASLNLTKETSKETKILTDRYNTQSKVVNELEGQFAALEEQIRAATIEALKFRLPTGGGTNFKNETDDILATARAFVKQFGEIFVTPDLEESFTNTKEIVKKSAIKLIDDVKNLNLQIKLPVQVITEADFLQPEINIDPNFKIDEGLRDSILKSLQAELKPIDTTVDVNVTPNLISKEQTKQIDELVKGFVELGDRGVRSLIKIDFTDVNKGIEDASKSLQNLNSEFQLTADFALSVGNSFASAFDALLEGEDPIKAFFKSIISELTRLIAKIIATKIAVGLLNLAFPGAGGAAGLLGGILGGGGGQANFGFGGSGSLRALDINVTGSVLQRGSDQLIMFSNSGRSLGRIQ